MCGVAKGMEKVGWDNVPILAVETVGAHSFYSAVQAGTLLHSPPHNNLNNHNNR